MKTLIICLIVCLAFAGNAQAVEPFDTQAGMAAYVNVGSLELENATEAYHQILNLSTTHAVGVINFDTSVYGGTSVYVYVDTNGWIVAYLQRDDLIGHMIYPHPDHVPLTTFEAAISDVCDSIGSNYTEIEGSIKYYNFEYPQAEKLLIFKNHVIAGNDYTNVFIPSAHSAYEISTFHYCPPWTISNFYVDGTKLSDFDTGVYGHGRVFEYVLMEDVPHTLRLYADDKNNVPSCAGSVIVYK